MVAIGISGVEVLGKGMAGPCAGVLRLGALVLVGMGEMEGVMRLVTLVARASSVAVPVWVKVTMWENGLGAMDLAQVAWVVSREVESEVRAETLVVAIGKSGTEDHGGGVA